MADGRSTSTRGALKKSERPRTCTESTQKVSTHLVICLFFYRFFIAFSGFFSQQVEFKTPKNTF
jgi:hypothetical protein